MSKWKRDWENYRVVRLSKACGGHLVISRIDPHLPGFEAFCPTGNTIEDLRDCLNGLLKVTQKEILMHDEARRQMGLMDG